MDLMEEFPFSPGQRVESKSNIKGFRGAWFRSEIKNIQIRRGEIWCAMHYIDFPDEKSNFMKAYQQDPSGKKKRVLMVRPLFPLISMGLEESIIKDAAGPVVVVNGDWCVGDLVDWFADGCFWAAKVTAVINKEFVQVELPGAPFGEGGTYKAAAKDIRPSLDWSMDKFWTVPCVKFCQHSLKADSVDVPPGSLTSPVKDMEMSNKEHFFIAKQELFQVPAVQDLNNTCDGDNEALFTRNLWGLGSESKKAKASDAQGINNLIASSQHVYDVIGNVQQAFPVRMVTDGAVVTPDMQKNGASDCVWVTGFGEQKFAPVDFYDRDLTGANKPPNEGPLLHFSAGEQWLGSSSCQPQEQANQENNKETSDLEALQKSSRVLDLNSKAEIDQNTSSKCDGLSTLNDMAETLLFEELSTSLGDEKLLDLSDERIGSSIVALEELISRIAWLRGVMQFGLKGWCKERRKRKWVFFEREGHPFAKSENGAQLM